MSNEYIYSYTSGSGSGSGSGTGNCDPNSCEPGFTCTHVAAKSANENIQEDGFNTIDWDKQYGPTVRMAEVKVPQRSGPVGIDGSLPRLITVPLMPPIRKGFNDEGPTRRCIKDCPPRPVGLDEDGLLPPLQLGDCIDCINGEWVERPKVPCAIPGKTGPGLDGAMGIVIDWPRGTGPRTHYFDTTFNGCATPNLVLENADDPAPWVVYTPPPCPLVNTQKFPDVIPPPPQTTSSIFELIRSQAGVTSSPVTNEPTPQSSIFSLVRSQATPITTVASLSIQQQQSSPIPILMMAQNVGTQSDGGGGLKCSVAPVSYTSDVTYNTGYENLDEVVDNTTSYVKGYIDYTLSTDTITVIEPKL